MKKKFIILLTAIFSICSCNNKGPDLTPKEKDKSQKEEDSINLKPRNYDLDIPTISITVNGAHIPDRSDPEYKNYCPAILNYEDTSFNHEDNEGKVRIRGTSSKLTLTGLILGPYLLDNVFIS